jgi:type I restriction enzyme M protein
MGVLVDRTHRELTDEDIARIASTYHAWRALRHSDESQNPPPYADIPGFCKSATLDEVRAHGHVLTPGRYVGAEAAEDDGEPFEEKMQRLVGELEQQFEESHRLEAAIRENMRGMGYGR